MSEANSRTRLTIIGAVVLALFAGLLTRLWFLQVAGGQDLAVQAQQNRDRTVIVPGVRGRILDSKGRVLAEDKAVDSVTIDRAKLTVTDRVAVVDRLALVLGMDPADVERAINDPKYSPYQPVPVAVNITFDRVLSLEEHRDQFPGVAVSRTTVRDYPYGATAAHVVGYIGKISARELRAREGQGYSNDDVIGKSGAEETFESELRGTPENLRVEVDSRGKVTRTVEVRKPVAGHDIQLALDMDAQQVAKDALEQAIEGARHTQYTGDTRTFQTLKADGGAVLVLDARTGSVVSLVSNPTFDPNDFVSGTVPDALFDPAQNSPLLDRALHGYAPGSTWKLITAIAELGVHVRDAGESIYDDGCIPLGDEKRCNARKQANGWINLPRALTVSSDVYFYDIGNEIWKRYRNLEGGDSAKSHPEGYAIQDTASLYGFGRPTGVGLTGDEKGRIPDLSFNLSRGQCVTLPSGQEDCSARTWRRGDSANLAVGQGDLLVTPLQLASAYAAFANGGTLYSPRLATTVLEGDVGIAPGQKQQTIRTLEPQVVRTTDLAPDIRDPVLAGLLGVVNDPAGTAKPAFTGYQGVPFAGKTGTAQREAGKQETSWFVGFTNPDNDPSLPQYVVLAMVEEGGYGADVAAPIVRRVVDFLNGNRNPPPVHVLGDSGRRD
jgi:penicillin-binding protein 2